MDKNMRPVTPMRPKAKTLAELLPGFKALLSKETVAMLSSIKKSSSSIHQTRTNVKNLKPMTIAEIRALQDPTPRKPQQSTSTRSKPWNSSVKVDKTKSLTGDGQMKHSTARKGLNFQSKPKPAANIGAVAVAAVSRKSSRPQAKASGTGMIRISGVYKMPETPVIRKPKQTSNLPCQIVRNVSFESNGDESFIQNEKEINDFEQKCDALTEEPTLEKLAEISPPTSTPFKHQGSFTDFSCHSDIDNSVLWNNNTIMSFEKTLENEDTERKKSSSESPCENLSKAIVPNSNNKNFDNMARQIKTKLKMIQDLNERQQENYLTMINNFIQMCNSMKEEKLETLNQITKLIHEINQIIVIIEPENVNTTIKEEKFSTENSLVESRPTVIKSKSPSYKIPRKSLCLRKKVFYKSVPNVSESIKTPKTPIMNSDKALNMYMQIKEHITFLNTPSRKPKEVPDTPARISLNLQKQLDKLYN